MNEALFIFFTVAYFILGGLSAWMYSNWRDCLKMVASYDSMTDTLFDLNDKANARVEELEAALVKVSDSITASASDTMWMDDTMGETIVDYIDSVLDKDDLQIEMPLVVKGGGAYV